MAVVFRHPLHWRSWRFRLVLGVAILVLLGRLVWGWHVGRLLAGQLAEIRGRGEPIRVKDVTYEAVPDAENAFEVLMRATKAHVAGVDSPRNSNLTYRDYPPYPAAWTTAAVASEWAHGRVFALAREARGLKRVQVRDRLTSPASGTMLQHLNQVRQLANTLCDGAALSGQKGEETEALDRVLDTLHLAWVIRHDEFLIAQLVAISIDAMAQDQVQIMAPGLKIPKGSVARERARELIKALLDEEESWRGVGRSIRLERVMALDQLGLESRGTWFIRPLAEMAMVRMDRNMDIAREAAQSRDWPGVLEILKRVKDQESNFIFWSTVKAAPSMPRYSRWFSDSGFYYRRTFETHFRIISDRRMTAVSLAAQMFRADRGRWPEKLEELVPEYLAAVPVDPCRGDRGPLGYLVRKGVLPGGGDRPLVYSDFGVDDPVLIKNEPMYGFQQLRGNLNRWNPNSRQYRDLARFEPLPEAVEGDPAKSDGPGKQAEKDKPGEKPKRE